MPEPKRRSLATLAVHAGTKTLESNSVPVVPPVHLSAVSYFESAYDLDRSLDGHDFVYNRITGQASALLEEAVAKLEGAQECVSYASGMAALKALLEVQELAAGDRVVMPSDGYGATRMLWKEELGRRGVELVALAMHDGQTPRLIEELKPRLVLAESITNPVLTVPELAPLVAACRRVHARFAVDATFASPILQRPVELGSDYAVQSTTKFINGHSDATGGTISGSRELIAPLKKARILNGAVLGPFEAWLTLRGLRTLAVRMRAHCENAERIAQRLVSGDLFDEVIYPGLPIHRQHRAALTNLTGGFGGLVSFRIRGADRSNCFRFLEALRLAKPAPSLGDVSTFVMHAASAGSRRMTPEERAVAGIGENLIRVSVGLEDPDEIADDLLQAIEAALDHE